MFTPQQTQILSLSKTFVQKLGIEDSVLINIQITREYNCSNMKRFTRTDTLKLRLFQEELYKILHFQRKCSVFKEYRIQTRMLREIISRFTIKNPYILIIKEVRDKKSN